MENILLINFTHPKNLFLFLFLGTGIQTYNSLITPLLLESFFELLLDNVLITHLLSLLFVLNPLLVNIIFKYALLLLLNGLWVSLKHAWVKILLRLGILGLLFSSLDLHELSHQFKWLPFSLGLCPVLMLLWKFSFSWVFVLLRQYLQPSTLG